MVEGTPADPAGIMANRAAATKAGTGFMVSLDEDLNSEKISGRVAAAKEWPRRDGALIKFKKLREIVAAHGVPKRPLLQIPGDPDVIGPLGDGRDPHLEQPADARTLGTEHGSSFIWIGARKVFEQIAVSIVVGVSVGIHFRHRDADPEKTSGWIFV